MNHTLSQIQQFLYGQKLRTQAQKMAVKSFRFTQNVRRGNSAKVPAYFVDSQKQKNLHQKKVRNFKFPSRSQDLLHTMTQELQDLLTAMFLKKANIISTQEQIVSRAKKFSLQTQSRSQSKRLTLLKLYRSAALQVRPSQEFVQGNSVQMAYI